MDEPMRRCSLRLTGVLTAAVALTALAAPALAYDSVRPGLSSGIDAPMHSLVDSSNDEAAEAGPAGTTGGGNATMAWSGGNATMAWSGSNATMAWNSLTGAAGALRTAVGNGSMVAAVAPTVAVVQATAGVAWNETLDLAGAASLKAQSMVSTVAASAQDMRHMPMIQALYDVGNFMRVFEFFGFVAAFGVMALRKLRG
jgi:hypothetical protein